MVAYLERRSGTVRQKAAILGVGKSSVGRLVARSLAAYVRRTQRAWVDMIPQEGPLLLVADAIWYRLLGIKHTIYCMLLRPKDADIAVILPPIVVSGHEDIAGWLHASNTLPENIRNRVGALVCDGGSGIVALVRHHGWILQRCQFHLLSAVQNYLTTGPRSKHPAFAREVMQDVLAILSVSSLGMAKSALMRLSVLRRTTRSRGLRRVLNGLALHLDEYRTCYLRPEWRLPATSNSAESFIQCVRDQMYRCRGFRSKERLILWLAAIAAHKKTIRCRPKNQPN